MKARLKYLLQELQEIYENFDLNTGDRTTCDQAVQTQEFCENGQNNSIYMTYKKCLPEIVSTRWKTLNPDWNIDFSLDKDCVYFLNKYYNVYVANLFEKIDRGMYKADLWRLCKLYTNGGVYADVDLIPHIDLNLLNGSTFYTCLNSNKTIFQAFIKSQQSSPLVLVCLISFLINNPYNNPNGPCFDMYNCIDYNLNNQTIKNDKMYNLSQVKIKIDLGISTTNTKVIDLYYFPEDIDYSIKLHEHKWADTFKLKINNNQLIVTRTDSKDGWGYNHFCDIVIHTPETVYLFQEHTESDWRKSYVSYRDTKILDSHDLDYVNKTNGW
jgi:hypothetical protein